MFGGLVGQASAFGSKAWWSHSSLALRNIDALLAFFALECGADEGTAALHAALAANAGESLVVCGETLTAFLQELSRRTEQADQATEGPSGRKQAFKRLAM